MKFDSASVRKCLKSYDFTTLFREHLGWDKHQATLEIPLAEEAVRLNAVAQKHGFLAYVCDTIPDRATRLKVDHQVTKSAREHFVIYTDRAAGQQVWQWVRREPGKPLASRDHRFDVNTSGDALIQRLNTIAISLDEEDSLTVVDVAGRAKAAFDVDKVTKKFYDRFKAEHAAFLKFIKGIKAQGDLEWYTSLMLNRLMFVYFIQKKAFLDGDLNYLQNRMKAVREHKGKDKFLSFYRYFLLRLFHDGLGKPEPDRKLDRELEKLIGKVPYLNGGFFEVHQLEERNPDIEIKDEAFVKLFAFFDEFAWHLDERPLRAGNEINPDVVGYIFEKYINQKQMGAYYTKEDITEYISKNTIIPFLFDAAEKKCPIAFKPDSALWKLLPTDPDRYLYAAIRKGVIDDKGEVIPLPKEIEAGVANVSKRGGWNKPAPEPFALPTETWREHVTRRQRCLEVRGKLARGEVNQINDLITLNLDLWQFARDAIVNCEGPELLRAFWHTINGRVPEKSNEKYEAGMTVLDPTCGSGAFLFAALRILETLYSDCLQSMASFVDEPEAAPAAPEEQLQALIARGENDRCEFKTTMRYDVKIGQGTMPEAQKKEVLKAKDKERNHDVLKSVAAMLNSAGGDVVIGITDEGTTFGLEEDYAFFSKDSERNPDGYELWLRQLFVNHFGVLLSQKIRAHFVKLDGKDVLWLRIQPGESAAYVLAENKQKLFYIRNGNETRQLEIEQIVAYHQSRFTPEAIKALPAPSPEPVTKSVKKRRYDDFRAVLAQTAKHPNERYFILKSIIISNLFGVDIMEEAVEICKLRLFLKLVANVETAEQIEPLPDIDFNIRAGNTLVGYVSLEEIRNSQKGTLGFPDDDLKRIEEDADIVERAFRQFRQQQTKHGGIVTAADKKQLRDRLKKLDGELDRYLAGEYGIDANKPKVFDAWKTSHQPFHWFVEFYGIMHGGGFDVIIGNPPYIVVGAKTISYGLEPMKYASANSKNLYSITYERSIQLASSNAAIGLIVQLTIMTSGKMEAIQDMILQRGLTIALPYPRRPEALFEGVEMPVAIILSLSDLNKNRNAIGTSRIARFYTEERPAAFATASLVLHRTRLDNCRIAKFSSHLESSILQKILSQPKSIGDFTYKDTGERVYYQEACRYWLKAIRGLPYFARNGVVEAPHHGRTIFLKDATHAFAVTCVLNSSLFYWYYSAFSDCEHVNDDLVKQYRMPGKSIQELAQIGKRLGNDLTANSTRKAINTSQGHVVKYYEYKISKSKAIIDEVDAVLAVHYGFTPEELDFIINYDIKYRMGQEDDGEEGE